MLPNTNGEISKHADSINNLFILYNKAKYLLFLAVPLFDLPYVYVRLLMQKTVGQVLFLCWDSLILLQSPKVIYL